MAGITYSMNDFYPNSSNVVQTSSETIPEIDEREHYSESTVSNEQGKTEMIDKKAIFITIGVIVGLLFMLNDIDV